MGPMLNVLVVQVFYILVSIFNITSGIRTFVKVILFLLYS